MYHICKMNSQYLECSEIPKFYYLKTSNKHIYLIIWEPSSTNASFKFLMDWFSWIPSTRRSLCSVAHNIHHHIEKITCNSSYICHVTHDIPTSFP